MRLYYGRLPQPASQLGPAVSPDEAVKNIPNGWNNRTIDDIYSLRPPHVDKLSQVDITEATAANMPKSNEVNPSGLSVVEDVTPEPKGSEPMESASVEVVAMGATYSLTAHFSRTVKEPGADFGSITCGFDIAETYPGEIDVDNLRILASDQFTAIKALVLTQLGLAFSMDEEGVIHEAFPGSQTVARGQATERQEPRQASRGTNDAPRGRQASTGARSGARTGPAASRGRSSAVPDQAELWIELVERPHEFYWNQNKRNSSEPDYISTKYLKDDGWPVSLWVEGRNGSNLPNDEDWLLAYDEIPEDAFAEDRPRRRD